MNASPARALGRPRSLRWTGLACLVLAAIVALVVPTLRSEGEPQALADRAREVASTLRCPVCQNLSVADSPSPLARQMRATIMRDLQAGRSPDEIRDRFAHAYGRWILLDPPTRGVDLAAWLLPALALVAASILAIGVLRRWTRVRPEAEPPGDQLPAEDVRLLHRALWGKEADAG